MPLGMLSAVSIEHCAVTDLVFFPVTNPLFPRARLSLFLPKEKRLLLVVVVEVAAEDEEEAVVVVVGVDAEAESHKEMMLVQTKPKLLELPMASHLDAEDAGVVVVVVVAVAAAVVVEPVWLKVSRVAMPRHSVPMLSTPRRHLDVEVADVAAVCVEVEVVVVDVVAVAASEMVLPPVIKLSLVVMLLLMMPWPVVVAAVAAVEDADAEDVEVAEVALMAREPLFRALLTPSKLQPFSLKAHSASMSSESRCWPDEGAAIGGRAHF
jgi:hypothetical protein